MKKKSAKTNPEKMLLVRLVRVSSGSEVWVKGPIKLEPYLIETGDCSELERAMFYEYPDWLVLKWAVVPKDSGEKMLCYGLEEIFQFNELF